MGRGQFTFYASIYESARRIRNKNARADFYDCICEYALNGTLPNLDNLSDAVAIGFISAKPNLDTSRRKAESGRAGGRAKQTGSKTQANSKQTGSEIEVEIEKELENEKELELEIEKDIFNNLCGGGGVRAREETADESDLSRIGIKPGDYLFRITCGIVSDVERITSEIMRTYCSRKYNATDCSKVFMYVVRFTDRAEIHSAATGLLLYAFEQANLAGKSGDWRYVSGVMERLAARNIETVEQAVRFDESRFEEE